MRVAYSLLHEMRTDIGRRDLDAYEHVDQAVHREPRPPTDGEWAACEAAA